jgi:hypothetical protein
VHYARCVAAIEGKIVQAAVVALLTPIYEAEFLGFSYGFRPGARQSRRLRVFCKAGTERRQPNEVCRRELSQRPQTAQTVGTFVGISALHIEVTL